MKYLLLSLLFYFTLGCQAPDNQSHHTARPNIILIIADDMAWDDSGAYGNPYVQTPNIDYLAKNGLRFDQAFLTTSSCSPSRSSIITGRYPHNTDAEQLHMPLPGEQITFVEQLASLGYFTGAAGKWHLGNEVRDRFDLILDSSDEGIPGSLKTIEDSLQKQGFSTKQSGCTAWLPLLDQCPEDTPFFLWLAAIDPHRSYQEGIIPDPHQPEKVSVPVYLPDHEDTRKDLAAYYDEISRMDLFIGEVINKLKDKGQLENTLIVFITDNGRPFPRDKTTLYDSGIKTPFIMHWPAGVEAGQNRDQLVSVIDLAPTFVELAGGQEGASFQGKSITSIMTDENSKELRPYIFAEHNWHDFDDRGRAIRSKKIKYIRNYYTDIPSTPPADAVRSPTFQRMILMKEAGTLTNDQGQCFTQPRATHELYDLENDPFELHNLASVPAYSETLNEMQLALDRWEEETEDRIPVERTADEFDRITGKALPNHQMPRLSKKERIQQGLLQFE